jgi:hypothetical protein
VTTSDIVALIGGGVIPVLLAVVGGWVALARRVAASQRDTVDRLTRIESAVGHQSEDIVRAHASVSTLTDRLRAVELALARCPRVGGGACLAGEESPR